MVSDERPVEERKLATVLFADLVGSTALADSTDAERTRALLNRFYDAMAAEIAATGGTVEKFIGDAVMAAFGAPAALEDHADRALHAALSMRGRLTELFGDTLALRIGVNTGEVIVGEPRVGSSFVTGDAVNVAARLEQAAEAGEILVGERTAAAVRSAFEFGEPASIPAKGKPAGVACRRLVGVRHAAERPARVFVGRESELGVLQRAFAAVVAEGDPRRLTIVGEAGVGKTALVWGVARVADAATASTDRACGPLPRPRLRQRVSTARPDRARSARPIGGRLAGNGAGAPREQSILGLTLGLPAPPQLHPLAIRGALQQAWTRFLQELSAEQPALVVLENLHWAQPELLERVVGSSRATRGPVLLLCTTRPELEPEGDTINIRTLSEGDANRIVEELAPVALVDDLRKFVVERAGGNPFFLEELLRTLVDRSVTSELPSDFVVPDTLLALLAARIDLLPAAEKAALQAGAVIGRTFRAEPVHELIGERAELEVLVERSFVRLEADEFTFVHALTREVAYGNLTAARRARLHARFATWLEHVGEGGDADAAQLARTTSKQFVRKTSISRGPRAETSSCVCVHMRCAGSGVPHASPSPLRDARRRRAPRARGADAPAASVVPIVGNELDIVEPGLRCRNGDENRILVSGGVERPRRLGRNPNSRPWLQVDDVVVELPLRAARDEAPSPLDVVCTNG